MELVAIKESKAAEHARNRNSSEQRRLSAQIKVLDNEHTQARGKTFVRILEAKEALRETNQSPHKEPMCPFGLTRKQKEAYRSLRRASLPSMSVGEFDRRLEEIKQKTSVRRRSDITTPYRGRRGSDSSLPLPCGVNIAAYQSTDFKSPLLSQKHKLKDVLKRVESEEVLAKNDVRRRRRSVSDIPGSLNAGPTKEQREIT